ncbi:MAG: HAD domain-containing protein [Peptostreptococcaceae bacterium]
MAPINKRKFLDLKERRVLFLDFDGVINNFGVRTDDEVINDIFMLNNIRLANASLDNVLPFNDLCIFCYMNDIEIVITSAWNISGFERCRRAMYELVGGAIASKVFIDATRYSDDLDSPVRSNEINEWLSANPDVKHFVLLDDCDDFSIEHKKFWVQTYAREGLTLEKVEEVKSMFKRIDRNQRWIDSKNDTDIRTKEVIISESDIKDLTINVFEEDKTIIESSFENLRVLLRALRYAIYSTPYNKEKFIRFTDKDDMGKGVFLAESNVFKKSDDVIIQLSSVFNLDEAQWVKQSRVTEKRTNVHNFYKGLKEEFVDNLDSPLSIVFEDRKEPLSICQVIIYDKYPLIVIKCK